MAHDAQEAEKDKRLAQQSEALPEGGRASLFLFLADGSTAVSYTHLDVYKRQGRRRQG